MRILTAILCAGGIMLASACSEEQPSPVAEIQVSAPGMHCEGCVNTVQETLAKMNGVDSVAADLDSKDVYVRVDTTLTSRQALENMIERLGYASAPAEEDMQ